MNRPGPSSRVDAALRVFAATLGTLPVALLAGACLARFLPLAPDTRFAIAFVTTIPIWVAAMCVGFLARSGARALAACILASAAMAFLVYGIPH